MSYAYAISETDEEAIELSSILDADIVSYSGLLANTYQKFIKLKQLRDKEITVGDLVTDPIAKLKIFKEKLLK